MARRVIRTGKIVGWPAVAIGATITVFGVVVMAANDVRLLIVVGWAALGLVVTGGHAASRLGYGPRFENH